MLADRQTEKQTDTLIAILSSLSGADRVDGMRPWPLCVSTPADLIKPVNDRHGRMAGYSK